MDKRPEEQEIIMIKSQLVEHVHCSHSLVLPANYFKKLFWIITKVYKCSVGGSCVVVCPQLSFCFHNAPTIDGLIDREIFVMMFDGGRSSSGVQYTEPCLAEYFSRTSILHILFAYATSEIETAHLLLGRHLFHFLVSTC